jgi:polygalacturonase
MALTQVTGPYPIFTDLDGTPLDDGYLYIGAINEDPEQNPIQVFWNANLTIPASQPIRTSNGYAYRNGTPALLYTGGEFSITIRNKREEFVLYSPVGYGFDPAAVSASVVKNDFVGDGVTVAFVLSAAPSTILATNAFINGVYQEKDSYGLLGNVITFSIAPPLNSSIEIMTNETGVINGGNATAISYTLTAPGAVAQTVQTRLEQYVSVKDFGAVGDGVADDTAAIQTALDSGAKVIYFPSGSYGLSADVNVTNSGQTLSGYGAEIIALSAGVGGFTLGFDGTAFLKTNDISIVGFTFTGANTSVSTPSGAITVYPPTTNPYVEGGGCSYISVSDCKFTGFTFGVIATAADNIRVTNCGFEGLVFHPSLVAGGYGVLAQTCFDVLVSNNTFTGAAGDRHAVYISKNASRPVGPNNVCKRVVVSNNIVDWTNVDDITGFESCLTFRGTYDLTVTGNILKNGYGAIDYVVTDGAGENIVIGNNVMHVRSAGVSSRAGVTFFGSVPSGFVAKNVTISNNAIYLYGPKAYGLVPFFSDNLNITGNTIRSEAAASDCLGIVFQNNNNVVLGSNIVELAGGGRAIYFQGAVDKITVDRQRLFGVGFLQFDASVGGYPTNITFNYPRRFLVQSDGAGNITVGNADQPEVISSATSSANGVVVAITPWLTNTDAYNFALGAPASQVGWVYHRSATPGVSVEIGVKSDTQSALSVPPPALPAATNIYEINGVVYN